ncbi:hypothetical protein Bbelb_330770 [Branchiostoma belcheri]|nr:hypothetical protein Bbelb_330770 [Branchiostoma belcheri]
MASSALDKEDELDRLGRDHVGIQPRYAGRGAPASRHSHIHIPTEVQNGTGPTHGPSFNIHTWDSDQVSENPKCGGDIIYHHIAVKQPSISVSCQGMKVGWRMRTGGCQDGYRRVGLACIRLGTVLKSFWDAQQACNAEGATLAMPKTEELDLALRRLVRRSGGNSDHWIGLRFTCPRLFFGTCWFGKWEYKWVDGLPLGRYQGWHPGEASHSKVPRALCVLYWYSGPAADPMWDDTTGCHGKKRYICQSPPV